MPTNKNTLKVDQRAHLGLVMGAGLLLGIANHTGAASRHEAYVHKIYDYIFELTCIMCPHNYEVVMMQKRDLLMNIDAQEKINLILWVCNHFKARRDALNKLWNKNSLDYNRFVQFSDRSLYAFLQDCLICLRLLENIFRSPGEYSNPFVEFVHKTQIKQPAVFKELFKPIVQLHLNGIKHLSLGLAWRDGSIDESMVIDLTLFAKNSSTHFQALAQYLEEDRHFNVVHFIHFNCQRHYAALMNILDLLHDNCKFKRVTLMALGSQSNAMLCAIAAKVRLMEVGLRLFAAPPGSEKQATQNILEITRLYTQWRAQEAALSNVRKLYVPQPLDLQIVPHIARKQTHTL